MSRALKSPDVNVPLKRKKIHDGGRPTFRPTSFRSKIFVQSISFNPNPIELDENAVDEKALDENWAHARWQ